MRNFIILLIFSLSLYSIALAFRVYYEVKFVNKVFVVDLSSGDDFEIMGKYYNRIVGAFYNDSYYYISKAYNVYKTLKPRGCFRPQTGYFLAPFSFAVLFSILLHLLNPHRLLINILVVFLTFAISSYYVPKIMLEPISANFIILSLIFLIIKRYNILLFFIFLTSILRPEFLYILIFLTIYLRTYLFGLILSTITLSVLLLVSIRCKSDQSNFMKWSARGYYEHIKHMDWQSAKEDMNKRGGFLKVLIQNRFYLTFLRIS